MFIPGEEELEDGEIRVTVLGSGNPWPTRAQASASILVEVGNSQRDIFIFDLGTGAVANYASLKLPVNALNKVFITHLHADHMGDMLTMRYALEVAKRLGWRSEPLPVYLPEQPTAEATLIASHPMVDAHFITDGLEEKVCGLDVRFKGMPHAVPSYAMAFSAGGKKFVYSGDTKDNEAFADFARNADMLLMDAAFLSKDKGPAAQHPSALDTGRIASDAQVKRLLITHIFPEYDPDELLREARKCYPAAEVIQENASYEV